MVRINLVDPSELTDQHLIAEHDEILMLCGCLRKSLKSKSGIQNIPTQFTLGKGHIKFFYDKGLYLHKRFDSLQEEMKIRGFKPTKSFPKADWPVELYNDWMPEWVDYVIIEERIKERVALKPHWYRYYGKPLEEKDNEIKKEND